MNVKCILLGTRSQYDKCMHVCLTPTVCHVGRGKAADIVKGSVVTRGRGEGSSLAYLYDTIVANTSY